MALYGLPSLPLGLAGSGQTSLTAEGAVASGLDIALDFTGQDMQANFDGDFQIADGQVAAKGAARIEAADLEPWLMTTGLSFPGMGLGTPVSLSADVDFGRGLLVVGKIQGEIADGPVSGDVNAEIKDGEPHLTGNLSLDAFDAAPVAAMVLGDASLQPAGDNWPTVPFQSKAAMPFTGELELTFSSIAAGIFGVLDDAHMLAVIARDGVRLADVSGRLDGGELTGLLEAKNNEGTALVSTQFKLAGADLRQFLQGSGLAGSGDFTASLSASGKSVEALVASLSGSGTAAIKDASIPGVNPDALPALLAGADRIGRDIDAARTAAFAPAIVSAGTLAAPSADIAFTVAAGVLRAPPVTLDAGKAVLSADLKTDFATGSVTAAGTVAYAPGDEALAGSTPAVRFTVEGPLGALSGQYDTEPLAEFLTQRALEREQARVEALQSALLEKQRLRREVRYYASLQAERDKAAEALRKAQEEARLAAEAKRRAEEEARLAEEARREAEEQAKAEAARRAEEAAKAAEEERRKAAEEAKRQADEEARRKAEEAAGATAEKERRKANEEAKRKAVEDAKRKAAEQARRKAEEATRLAEEKQTNASSLPGVRSRQLPEAQDAPQANGETGRRFDPLGLGEFLKELGN